MSLSTRSPGRRTSIGFHGRRDLVVAWTSLALVCLFTGGAVWVMNAVSWDLSFWASELVLVAGVAVVLLFAGGAILFGQRAVREGQEAGRIPVVIGYTIGGMALIWAVIPIVGRLSGFE
ncbi:MAG TPA: hypothetical protein VF108_07470 [Actinomycetota bacterium]